MEAGPGTGSLLPFCASTQRRRSFFNSKSNCPQYTWKAVVLSTNHTTEAQRNINGGIGFKLKMEVMSGP
jgi:hypothetical protein